MALVPKALTDWLQRTYPSPSIDPEWLSACYTYLTTELRIAPGNTAKLIEDIDVQLLQSDLHDSMLENTGFHPQAFTLDGKRFPGPILCQITAMTDIGHSAFSLRNVRQTRIDKEDLAGLGTPGEDEEDEGPIPKYPRGMLRFQLSDGYLSIKAIEYRKLPTLQLGETPLGYKMILKNVLFRRGIAFLEPACVRLLGHRCEELDEFRDADFARGLRLRQGLPHDEEDARQRDARGQLGSPPGSPRAAQAEAPAPAPAVAAALGPRHEPPQNPRSEPRPPQAPMPPSRSRYFVNAESAAHDSAIPNTLLSPVSSRPAISYLTGSSSTSTLVRSSATLVNPSKEEDFDFGDDMEFDEEMLAGLDAAEHAALMDLDDELPDEPPQASRSSSFVPVVSQSYDLPSNHRSSDGNIPSSTTLSGSGENAESQRHRPHHQRAPMAVISIDSDDEKENAPLMEIQSDRSRRARVAARSRVDDVVIEISD